MDHQGSLPALCVLNEHLLDDFLSQRLTCNFFTLTLFPPILLTAPGESGMCQEIHIARTGPIPAPAPWATVHRLMAGVRRCSVFSIWVTFRALGSPEAGALAIPGGYSPWCLLGPWPTCPYLNMPGRSPPQGLHTDCSPRCLHHHHTVTSFSSLLRCALPINTSPGRLALKLLPTQHFLPSAVFLPHFVCLLPTARL